MQVDALSEQDIGPILFVSVETLSKTRVSATRIRLACPWRWGKYKITNMKCKKLIINLNQLFILQLNYNCSDELEQNSIRITTNLDNWIQMKKKNF